MNFLAKKLIYWRQRSFFSMKMLWISGKRYFCCRNILIFSFLCKFCQILEFFCWVMSFFALEFFSKCQICKPALRAKNLRRKAFVSDCYQKYRTILYCVYAILGPFTSFWTTSFLFTPMLFAHHDSYARQSSFREIYEVFFWYIPASTSSWQSNT